MVKLCSIENCKNEYRARGYCNSHYKRLMKYGDPLHVPDPTETRKKQSKAKKGIIPWNKGKVGVFSTEALKKMSESQKKNTKAHYKKGKLNPSYGKIGNLNPMYGKKHSKEVREKISIANTGRKHSEKSRKNMSLGQKGKKLSETAKRNISESKKGKKNPMFGKTGKNNPFYGHHHTEEVKRQKSIQSKEFANRPEIKEAQRQVLRKSRHSQVKPNNRESQIGQILTDAQIRFKFHRNVDYQTIENEHRKKEVDIFIRPKKIIEHNGTYNHADPRKYKPDDLIREHGRMVKASEIWKREKTILKQIKKQGYKVLVIWESELKEELDQTTKKILKFAKS